MIPNCEQEIYNIHVSTSNVEQYGSSSNVNFVATFNMPLKDVVRAELVTASIACNTSNVVYINVDELNNKFTDFANAKEATGSTDHGFDTTSSILRSAFGSMYNDDIGSKERITYYNRYPIVAEYPYPIQRLNKLSIKLYDQYGDLITDQGTNFFTFRFVCNRRNLC